MTRLSACVFASIFFFTVVARCAETPPAVSQAKDGKLQYVAGDHGNRIPDFSTCGYMGGGVEIPNMPVRVVVPQRDGDSTARIQAAIDYVASLHADDNGIRGAVLLAKGKHEILGGLKITTSGVVLRGNGATDGGTTLLAAGNDRRTLISIAGKCNRKLDASPTPITAAYIPVGATRLPLRGISHLKTGDDILITRPSTADWIKTIGMDNMGGERHAFSWKPGTRDLAWDRTITKIDADEITIDSPITTALDQTFGGGSVSSYTWPGRIRNVGVENLRCESAFDAKNPKDEEHSWFAITIDNAADAWVRQVTMSHFAGGAVTVFDGCRRVTVEDCKSLAPISEIAGYRRHTFFTSGQQTLFQRCYSEQGRHDFSVGFCAAGPNAFVQCEAKEALDDSGPIDSWASGVLYDNARIDGNMLSLCDRAYRAQGAGWSAANCVIWQSTAAVVNCFAPPTANNWVFGTCGQFNGNGQWSALRESVKPQSLYYGQLTDRLGPRAMKDADLLSSGSEPSSNPPVDVAARLTSASKDPAPLLLDWIDTAAKRHPIPLDAPTAKSIDDPNFPAKPGQSAASNTSAAPPRVIPVAIHSGLLTLNAAPLTGSRQSIKWWAGGIRPDDLAKPEPSPTRYVPGRIGRGLTDDLDVLTDDMRNQKRIAIEHHYGLWYDTRDTDHERMRRMDGDVTPPFYEYPFERSGTGVAWDGLSKYDLTKYNVWYFSRLKQLADLCDAKGLVLIQQHFFQHNIIEAGAHWASCPWRTANNINDTGFPEPPNYAGDKRVFMAEQFYDVSHPLRREIYRKYIRHCLDTFADNANVIQETSAENSGPLHFMQFWLDTIAEWEKETGKHAMIALAAPKDVQDTILADEKRAAVVDIIDIRYWWYQPDGTAYAPPGGQNLAPRQQLRLYKPKGSSAEQAARAVKEYREKFPDKPVIYSADGYDRFGKAARDAGGSLAP